MKVVILAGGLGTRLAEENEVKPKPMAKSGRPLVWHICSTMLIMVSSIPIALGYRGELISVLSGLLRLSGSMTLIWVGKSRIR